MKIPSLFRALRILPALILSSVAAAHAAGVDSVSVKPFGKTTDGTKVSLYSLTNKNGMKLDLMTYGATVVNLDVPDRNGKFADVVLGFDTLKPYLTKSPYFGAIVGRYGNRIAKGHFVLEGKAYQLGKNDGPNHLHGGFKGFDKQVWKGEVVKSPEPSVRFTLHSPDGQEGYPGNLDAAVTYTLTDNNQIRISYRAVTDKPTILNLTNHTYYNLAGKGSILGHLVKLNAARYNPVSPTMIPTGELKPVAGTVMDFRTPTAVGARIKQVGGKPVGYDHNYILSRCPLKVQSTAAVVYEPKSGRVMTVTTDQPGIQFYSGNFLDGTITGKAGRVYHQYAAMCLETQHFPDSPNEPKFPSTELKPGQVYATTSVYKFSAQ